MKHQMRNGKSKGFRARLKIRLRADLLGMPRHIGNQPNQPKSPSIPIASTHYVPFSVFFVSFCPFSVFFVSLCVLAFFVRPRAVLAFSSRFPRVILAPSRCPRAVLAFFGGVFWVVFWQFSVFSCFCSFGGFWGAKFKNNVEFSVFMACRPSDLVRMMRILRVNAPILNLSKNSAFPWPESKKIGENHVK